MSNAWLHFSVPVCLAVHVAYWLAWGGSLALSLVLAVLMWTRWGQSRPLQKCAALSLLVHLILAFLTMTVRIVAGDGGGGGGSPIRVRIVHDSDTSNAIATFAAELTTDMAAPPLLEAPAKTEKTAASKPEEAPALAELADHKSEPVVLEQPTVENTPKVEPNPPSSESVAPARPQETGIARTNEKNELASNPPTQDSTPPQPTTASAAQTYSLRNASDRLSLVEGQGGNAKTEAAVVAALNWLAAAQSGDGRWNANQFGAGQEQAVLGQNRGGAGRNADTGVSALALLAFLGAGHSHLHGEYRDVVHRGIDFLLRSQAADGSLFGEATLYAQMYCHSMATFALAEAQAMSGDRRLEPAVRKAVNFSLAAQNGGTGGWRYRPGDTGDTSQLGWQVMALASAKRAGIDVPDQTWIRVERFLRTVRRGNYGGLASYRSDSPASTSMTAEALYCHLILEEMSGPKLTEFAANEATNQVLTALPTADRVNLYYWYYATLALHRRQQANDSALDAWHTWNDALTAALLETQVAGGPNAGSWNANTVWGGYGGRVYTTAMAAMCLEVYYRYAPAPGDRAGPVADRPGVQPLSK
jgi:hypothetical protein